MFHTIPAEIRTQMQRLELLDAADRTDGTPRSRRLRQIPEETGKLLAVLAASIPSGDVIEIGTSAGYSSLWISLGCAEGGRSLTTYEIDPAKSGLARETFHLAGVQHRVNLVPGDARTHIADHREIGFCFLDAEKVIYGDCYESVVPRLVRGGMIIADNVVSHADSLQAFLERAEKDDRVDALRLPVGKGLLVCRKA